MKKLYLFTIVVLSLTSCSSEKTLYSWYNYVDSSYKYEKEQTPESMQKLMADYDKMIKKQKGVRKVVPPGIYAEKAYTLVLAGKPEEGIPFFKKEMELYPESTVYIERIIKQLEK